MRSLTTISTPHHGESRAGDFLIRRLDEVERQRHAERLGEKLFAGSLAAARELTTESLDARFNPATPDVPGVKYYRLGFYIPAPVELHSVVPWLWAVHAIIDEAGYPRNDGMVSVESARWGVDLGSLPGGPTRRPGRSALGGPSFTSRFSVASSPTSSAKPRTRARRCFRPF